MIFGWRSRSQWRNLRGFFHNSLLPTLLWISANLCLIKMKFVFESRFSFWLISRLQCVVFSWNLVEVLEVESDWMYRNFIKRWAVKSSWRHSAFSSYFSITFRYQLPKDLSLLTWKQCIRTRLLGWTGYSQALAYPCYGHHDVQSR